MEHNGLKTDTKYDSSMSNLCRTDDCVYHSNYLNTFYHHRYDKHQLSHTISTALMLYVRHGDDLSDMWRRYHNITSIFPPNSRPHHTARVCVHVRLSCRNNNNNKRLCHTAYNHFVYTDSKIRFDHASEMICSPCNIRFAFIADDTRRFVYGYIGAVIAAVAPQLTRLSHIFRWVSVKMGKKFRCTYIHIAHRDTLK